MTQGTTSAFVMHGARDAVARGLAHIEKQGEALEHAMEEKLGLAFGQKEEEFNIIRAGAAQILRGERPLPVYAVVGTPKPDEDLAPDEKRNDSTGKTASPGSGSEG